MRWGGNRIDYKQIGYIHIVSCLWLLILLFRIRMRGREKIIWDEIRWQRLWKNNSCLQTSTTYLTIVVVSPNITNKF